MPHSAIYKRYVFRSKVCPLPRRMLPALFKSAEQAHARSHVFPKRFASQRIAVEALRRRQNFPVEVTQRPEIPEPPDTSTHVYIPLTKKRMPPRARAQQRHWRRPSFRFVPGTPSTYSGFIRGKMKLVPTIGGGVELRPTYRGEIIVVLPTDNTIDIVCTMIRDSTDVPVTDATLTAVVYDPHGAVIATVTLTLLDAVTGEYRGSSSAQFNQGVNYFVDVRASNYKFRRITTEPAVLPEF